MGYQFEGTVGTDSTSELIQKVPNSTDLSSVEESLPNMG